MCVCTDVCMWETGGKKREKENPLGLDVNYLWKAKCNHKLVTSTDMASSFVFWKELEDLVEYFLSSVKTGLTCLINVHKCPLGA